MVHFCKAQGIRAKYAMARMKVAQDRMLLALESNEEWERAYKWANAWGLASRVARSCLHIRACSQRTDTCPK